MIQCQGGWCVKREKCPHYHAGINRSQPADRLCIPGSDGYRLIEATPFRTLTIDVFKGREVAAERRVPA